jgi:gluconate 2-dehydrogenase gamma chain
MDSSGEEKAAPRPLSRSELLKRAGVLGAAAAVPAGLAPEAGLAEAELAELRKLKALSPGEAATIAAFCERLIPSDATGPGAREANVIRYIDRALAGDLIAFRPAYTAAVRAIDAYSESRYGAVFTALPPDKQDAVLNDMDLNRLAPDPRQDPTVARPPGAATPGAGATVSEFLPNPKAVFEMIRTHAVQGMFGDPAHGGNTNFVGWKLVRFPGPRLVISARDQRLNVVPKSSLRSTYSIPLFRSLQSKGG